MIFLFKDVIEGNIGMFYTCFDSFYGLKFISEVKIANLWKKNHDFNLTYFNYFGRSKGASFKSY